MNFFDSHAHLTDLNAYEDKDIVIKRAIDAGVKKIVNICCNIKALQEGIELSKKYDFIYNSAATSPHDVEKEGGTFFPIVETAAEEKKIIAIGESGLDYYYEHSQKETQKKFLIKYLNLAKKYQLPVVLHAREAFSDIFEILDEYYQNQRAVIHCFSGTKEEAKSALDRGLYISFSGIITFKKTEVLKEVVKFVPLDRILIETDSPFLAPLSKRGKKNEPSFIVETAKAVSEIKGVSFNDLAKKTYENTMLFFNIKES
ncbi:MAG: TatD family hydrolase [Parachlamydiales bacterium]|jgi:TatD DNase family protein